VKEAEIEVWFGFGDKTLSQPTNNRRRARTSISAGGITQRTCYSLLQLQTFSGVMFSHIFRFRPPKEVRLVTNKVPARMKFPKLARAGFSAI